MHLPTLNVIELRQYTMKPGRRGELIELFEREFIESQNAVGLHVLGIFSDAERDDRFVWLRGFTDMVARQRGSQAFYGGPVWQAHRAAANAASAAVDRKVIQGLPGRRNVRPVPRSGSGCVNRATASLPPGSRQCTVVPWSSLSRQAAMAGFASAWRTARR